MFERCLRKLHMKWCGRTWGLAQMEIWALPGQCAVRAQRPSPSWAVPKAGWAVGERAHSAPQLCPCGTHPQCASSSGILSTAKSGTSWCKARGGLEEEVGPGTLLQQR